MPIVDQDIREHDVVQLRESAGRWLAGQTGTVVAVTGEWRLVEIADGKGVALDFISVPASRLKIAR